MNAAMTSPLSFSALWINPIPRSLFTEWPPKAAKLMTFDQAKWRKLND